MKNNELDRGTRVGEAGLALAGWKAEVIGARSWRRYVTGLIVLASIAAFVESNVHHTFYACFTLLVLAFVAYVRGEYVLGARQDAAYETFRQALQALDYGDDIARAASRGLLRDAQEFEKRWVFW